MTEFFTDFSEYPTGSPPSDWTLEADIGGTIMAGAGAIGNFLRLSPTERWQTAIWDLPGSSSVTEVAAMVRSSDLYAFTQGAGPCIFESGGFFGLYGATLGNGGNERNLIEDTGTFLDTGTFSNFIDVWVWIRLAGDASGNLRAWFWDDGATPKTNADASDLSANDTTFTSGGTGICIDISEAGTNFDVAAFGVGTDGDSAPIVGPDPGGDPSISKEIILSVMHDVPRSIIV